MDKKFLLLTLFVVVMAFIPAQVGHADEGPYTCDNVGSSSYMRSRENVNNWFTLTVFSAPDVSLGGEEDITRLFFAPGRVGEHELLIQPYLGGMPTINAYWTDSSGDITSWAFLDWHRFDDVISDDPFIIRLYNGDSDVRYKFEFSTDNIFISPVFFYNFYCAGTAQTSGNGNINSETGDSLYDTPSAAQVLNFNVVSNSTGISPGDDEDWYKFTLTQPSGVTVETFTENNGDTEIWLYTASNTTNHIAYDDDVGGSLRSVIEKGCYGGDYLEAGTYYVKVGSYGTGIVTSYNVKVTAVPCTVSTGDNQYDTPAAAQMMTMNIGSQPTSINPGSDVDWYKFTLAQSSGTTVETFTENNGDTEIWLYAAGNTTSHIAYDDDAGGGSRRSVIEKGCYGGDYLGAGTYYVKVGSYGTNIVTSYNVKVTAVPCTTTAPPSTSNDAGDVAAQAVTINPNSTRTDSITPASDVDWFKFTLNATSAVELATSGSSGDTQLWLYDGGGQIDFNDDNNTNYFSYIGRSCANALPAGTYYVMVDSWGHAETVPNYTLSLNVTSCGSSSGSSGNTGSQPGGSSGNTGTQTTCAAPTLLEPLNGATLQVGTLRWSYNCTLAANEYFDVRVWHPGDPHYGVTWTKDTSYPYAGAHGTGTIYWSVAVVRGHDGVVEANVTNEADPRWYSVPTNGSGSDGGGSNPEPPTQDIVTRYYAGQPACGPTNNIKLTVVPISDRMRLWVYVQKCEGGAAFVKSGYYYIQVDGVRRFGPFNYYAGTTYAREDIAPVGANYVGFHSYQVELYPQDQDDPIWTGVVTVEGREEPR